MSAAVSKVTLRIVAGPHEGEERVFASHDAVIVGRAADAQWRMSQDSFFSRYHFRIEANPPACALIDVGSSNGTLVNGQRVTQVDLTNGDRIECGDTVFAVRVSGPVPSGHLATVDMNPGYQFVVVPVKPPPPSRFPRPLAEFDLTREIARGGMGIVYHAIHRATGREVALKVVRPEATAAADAFSLFVREATILGRLRHPRIVEYFSIGMHEGSLYLAMEYLPIVDFRKLLATQSRPKQIRLACGVICRVLEALHHAHGLDIVHRDIKPANILTYKQNGRLLAKLADFGLAKNYQEAGFTALSSENDIRGTLAYMAPEQVLNCRYARPPCDIYSAGACLYKYLSDKSPHEGAKGASIIGLILNESPRPVIEVAPDVPLELSRLIDRALARDPADRFPSAEAMRQALVKFEGKQ
jgi:serine/threonine-protein kinase